MRHISVVHQPSVTTLGLASIVQIGDTKNMELINRTIVVQREIPSFLAQEGRLEAYKIFVDDEITIPTRINEVKMNVININPFIEVNCIVIESMLNSSCLHIGSVDYVYSNSRILQIRHFVTEEPFEK
ncbi:spore germination protein GerPE [Bacillus sp. S13(2024)]|uniref:spore germination protein GerPE n=1 Tax=unclassified Bacillus (in: firmicutes) TaxID=185979 RepID=UPI003D205BA5